MVELIKLIIGLVFDIDLILCILFPILRLCNVITWSWGIVLIPLYIFISVCLGMVMAVLYELDKG